MLYRLKKDEFKFKPKPFAVEILSSDDRTKTTLFLDREIECDRANYQEMLNVVDLTTLTKAKIIALSKLGKQYEKQSKSLMLKYNTASPKFNAKEKKWIL